MVTWWWKAVVLWWCYGGDRKLFVALQWRVYGSALVVVCRGCKSVVWMVSWWKFWTLIGHRISWWTETDQEGYRCCLDMVVGVLTGFFWMVVSFGCGVCVLRRLWFGSIFLVVSCCWVFGCFYVGCFHYGRSMSWAVSFSDIFSIFTTVPRVDFLLSVLTRL